jgi:EAL domain-containing protein (putative c-di-GMP-specific phosphodiesterase class I)
MVLAIQDKLKNFAKVTNGTYAEMSNGDVFIIWEETSDAKQLTERLLDTLPLPPNSASKQDTYLLAYHLPKDYTALRERANHYVEVVRAATTFGGGNADATLTSDTARGPLTPWSVDQIGKLLDEIDLRTYARTQKIYRMNGQTSWEPVGEEYFVSFDNLRRERFPKLDLITPEHLFFALCEIVDQRFLAVLTESHATIAGRKFFLNLSVATVIGSVFARFTHSIPRNERGLLTFELHRADLFQDFARTLGAIEVLHREGFKIAIDSVTPDILPYLNVNAFGFDTLKVNVSGDRVGLLADAAIRKALLQLPLDKVIFFRCDSDKALTAGRDLGINLYQGWHIDDLAGQPPKSPR